MKDFVSDKYPGIFRFFIPLIPDMKMRMVIGNVPTVSYGWRCLDYLTLINIEGSEKLFDFGKIKQGDLIPNRLKSI